MTLDPHEAAYWLNKLPAALRKLAAQTSQTPEQVAEQLAYIRGDYLNMTDADVLDTFRGDLEIED